MTDKDPKNETVVVQGDSNSTVDASHSGTFDLASIRLSQDFATTIGVKKLITTVPVRKPNRQEFVRVHPDPKYHLDTAVVELKAERETYVVAPSLWPEVHGELIPKRLLLTMTRQNVLTLWPIRLPGEDGRIDQWNQSAMIASERATQCWVRVASARHLGAYELFEAPADLPDPEWPEISFQEIFDIAFRGYQIDDINHPVLKQLRGEI
jgi:hypothetical protein